MLCFRAPFQIEADHERQNIIIGQKEDLSSDYNDGQRDVRYPYRSGKHRTEKQKAQREHQVAENQLQNDFDRLRKLFRVLYIVFDHSVDSKKYRVWNNTAFIGNQNEGQNYRSEIEKPSCVRGKFDDHDHDIYRAERIQGQLDAGDKRSSEQRCYG